MNTILSPGNFVVVKQSFLIYDKRGHTHNEPGVVEEDSLSLVLAVINDKFNGDNILTLYVMCSKSGQLGWTYVYNSTVDQYFSVLTHA